MKKRIFFETCEDDANLEEKEYYYNPPQDCIPLALVMNWLENIGSAGDNKYLKCVVSGKGGSIMTVFNISEIKWQTVTWGTRTKPEEEYPFGICIILAESSKDAMTFTEAKKQFDAIIAELEKNGVDYKDKNRDEVQIFITSPKGKAGRGSWYFDDEYDTGFFVRNTAPLNLRRWLKAGMPALQELTKSPKKPDAETLEDIDAQLARLKAKRDMLAARQSAADAAADAEEAQYDAMMAQAQADNAI